MNAINKTLAGLLLATGLCGAALADGAPGNTPYAAESFGQQADLGSGAYSQTFTLPADTVLEAIQWWGFHGIDSGGPGFDHFTVSLGGQLQIGTLTSEAVTAADGSYLYSLYTLDVVDSPLKASSLSIVNDSGDVEWYWQSAAAVGNAGQASATDVAFRLQVSAVPEPGHQALLLLGLACIGGLRMRARR